MHKNQILSLVALLGISLVGCKSGPHMAWWQKGDDKESSTALASEEPQLPADIAKAMEAKDAAQLAVNEAKPFVPGAAGTRRRVRPGRSR